MKKVRAEPELEKMPIIVFSNTYLSNMVQDAWKAGATKCLSKASCSPKQLISIVRNVVNGDSTANGQTAESNGHASPKIVQSTPEPAADPKKIFHDSVPSTLSALRMLLQAVIKEGGTAQILHLESMYRHVHSLTGKAALAGLYQTAHMGDAIEALLKELHDKPNNINASTLRTAASAIDFLGVLVDRDGIGEQPDPLMANILVVDDEPISRRAVTHALERAKLKAVSVDNPEFAYDLICENNFELIFLDVDMPGMTGYELCGKLRTLPTYKTTPVVFVTGLADFETRANSMMSGGNDFIAKPFLFIELAVKALLFVLRSRL
jgi:CheY-like chemotaxis protein